MSTDPELSIPQRNSNQAINASSMLASQRDFPSDLVADWLVPHAFCQTRKMILKIHHERMHRLLHKLIKKKTTVTKQWQANHMYGMSHGLQPSSKLESNCESAHRPGPQLWCQQCFSSSHSYMENQDMSQRCMCDSGCSVSAPEIRRESWCIIVESVLNTPSRSDEVTE